jgi:hypothetical protein
MPRIDPRIFMLVLFTSVAVPHSAVAGVRKCTSHSLSRDDAAAAAVAARAGLPRSVQVFVVGACFNSDNAAASIETRKTTRGDGVRQWWTLECSREISVGWHCNPAELKQMIRLSEAIGGQRRTIELSFDKDVSLERARELAIRAITTYQDHTVDLRDCATGDVVDLRRGNGLPSGLHPIRVTVNRESGAESASLDDVDLSFSVPAVGNDGQEPVSCWSLWVVVG